MKYKITEITTSTISVLYDDKTTAIVPIYKGQDKNLIKLTINQYHNSVTPFDKVTDIPFSVDDDGDTIEDLTSENTYDYKFVRQAHYPSLGDQMDAAYKARLGDTTEQTTIDSSIKAVKEKYPKDDTKYKDSDLI